VTLSAGALRTNHGFRRYLAARVVSTAGTLVTAVVLPVLMYRLTGSAAWTAAVVAAEALPHLLLAPVAAPVAARLNRRRLLFVADLAGAALLGSIPLAWWQDELSGWQVLAVACAVQAVFVLLEAAQTGALHALVGPELTPAGGVGLRGATGLVELMVPPLAGLAVVVVAPAPLLTLDAVSFLASALLVRAAFCKSCRTPGPGARGRVRPGLRFLSANPPSWTLVLAGTLHAAAGAAFLAMLLPWADRYLGVPPSGDLRLALLVSCWALGAVLGCAVAPALIRRLGPVRLARKGMAASLLCALGVLLCPHWLLAVLTGLLWGAAHTVTARAAIHALGRPARPAARMFWRGIGPVIGAVLAGAVAVWSSPRAGLAVGVVLVAIAALGARRGVAPLPPGAVPAQTGPGQAGDGIGDCPGDCTGECAENCTTDQRLIGP
jgi:MFS family permease